MSQTVNQEVRWTTADLELLPENGTRYEIIDGELFMSRSPHLSHQRTCGNMYRKLQDWSEDTGLGEAFINPGIIFTEADNVEPDVIWISKEKLAALVDDSGHLTGAPELVVEVLSSGVQNERRDREAKLKLYSVRGVQEYWIVDWRLQKIEVYRRSNLILLLTVTLFSNDEISSPLLPNFSCLVSKLF
ncbi:Uma2 family endonuclease [Coleofasciculus sp. FACHB-T130]|uniref:Uma2 family endonuclease n=1 Tax=Cyanophyceae TaxID=3028117 RepID=UPI0016884177|nr:Uma2 family endonuclease [Coleofasciculus sp. FACHB-T130]MBD1878195.1 Uma2 family endonuclease [Coleofasciculus sp. FACHB-T130]